MVQVWAMRTRCVADTCSGSLIHCRGECEMSVIEFGADLMQGSANGLFHGAQLCPRAASLLFNSRRRLCTRGERLSYIACGISSGWPMGAPAQRHTAQLQKAIIRSQLNRAAKSKTELVT